MCRAALESSRKSIIFDPYPSVVDPFDHKALAFNPKVMDFICCYAKWICDQFIIQQGITNWLHLLCQFSSHFIILWFYFPFCWQKRSYDRLQKALDSIMSIREITQVWQEFGYQYHKLTSWSESNLMFDLLLWYLISHGLKKWQTLSYFNRAHMWR